MSESYRPKVVRARLKTGGKTVQSVREKLTGHGFTVRDFQNIIKAGNYLDGLEVQLSLWSWDNHENWHLWNWKPEDDEKVMLAMYQAEQFHPFAAMRNYKNNFEQFKEDWKNEEYDPGASYTFSFDEGDPLLLASKRQTTFWNKKQVDISTPTIKGASRIEVEYENSSMGVPLGTGAIKTMRTNVVGRGLMLKPTVDASMLGITPEAAQTLNEQIQREWSLWADSPDCDMARLDNFYELQQLAFMGWLMSGDTLALLPTKHRINQPYDLRIQLIEADRLSSPNYFDTFDNQIVGGVEVDKQGEVVAYHFSKQHPLSRASEPIEWVRVEAYGSRTGRRNVLHLMNRERIDQRRGVPFLAPVIEALKQLGRYTDAELVAAVVSGMFTVFIEKTDNSEDAAIGAAIPAEVQVDAEDETTLEMAPGAILDLAEGEKPNVANPGRPNANFDGFVTAICRQIGTALEIPYELLMKHFTASYSASRGALEEAWKSFRMYREWMTNDFCQPIYEEWLSEAVAKERISAPGFFTDPLRRKAFCKAQWNGPARGLLVKVIAAQVQRQLLKVQATDWESRHCRTYLFT